MPDGALPSIALRVSLCCRVPFGIGLWRICLECAPHINGDYVPASWLPPNQASCTGSCVSEYCVHRRHSRHGLATMLSFEHHLRGKETEKKRGPEEERRTDDEMPWPERLCAHAASSGPLPSFFHNTAIPSRLLSVLLWFGDLCSPWVPLGSPACLVRDYEPTISRSGAWSTP